jgi:hypothetical protein
MISALGDSRFSICCGGEGCMCFLNIQKELWLGETVKKTDGELRLGPETKNHKVDGVSSNC